MAHRVFGIRHHGPGSALSLRAALDAWRPDCVLLEGPPEADGLLPLAADPDMHPPVALLAYATEAPSESVFYPFAAFSPEWVAMQWALAAGTPLRFIDLPLAWQLKVPTPAEPATEVAAPEAAPEATAIETATTEAESDVASADAVVTTPVDQEQLAWQRLCEAGGFADSEALWDRLVETRATSSDEWALFTAVTELMAELRKEVSEHAPRELRREAHMRQEIRRAIKDGHERIAVVCGAWHAPVLAEVAKGASADAALLKGLSKTKVSTTWIPWSFGRLTRSSGYGAGIESPGWYSHLFANASGDIAPWFTEAARVFRRHDLDVSPAHVIEAVRLADCLASLRGYAEPSLSESLQAIEAIYCAGNPVPLQFLSAELLVGERMGQVPASVPEPALSADLRAEQKRLRLKSEATQRVLDLDLRNDTDLARSRLLHRLAILRVPWGELQAGPRKAAKNTFHELWSVAWKPELTIALIEAGRFGNTIDRAAHSALLEAGAEATRIGVVAGLLQQALQADCAQAIAPLTQRLDALAAASSDVPELMQALVRLAPVLRYGDVRRTDVGSLAVMLAHYAERICVGLPLAVGNIGDELAEALSPQLGECDQAMRQLASEGVDIGADWEHALGAVARSLASHRLLAGRAVRLLLSRSAIDGAEAARLLSQALSPGVVASQARWLEGLLSEGGLFLIHDPTLLALLDDWLQSLSADQFELSLPIVRRAFSAMSKPERRQIGAAVTGGASEAAPTASAGALDWSRAEHVVPTLVRFLRLEKAS